MDDLRYPTGRFQPKGAALTPEERAACVARIAGLPGELRHALDGLEDGRLDTPYREGGWSPRQIAHHLADSHMNAFVRFKLGLTEEVPTIKTYEQEPWAVLGDVRGQPVDASVRLLEGLHLRWVALLRSLTPQDFGRRLRHPELGELDLDFLLQMYSWHGQHHVAQVTAMRARQGW